MSSNIQILAYEQTPLGPLCLRQRELLSMPGTVVTEVTLNHEFLMSSYNTDSERAISNLAVQIHGGDGLKVLVGGLGLGHTAFELLRADQVQSVEVVEFLPQVIDWMTTGLVPLADQLVSNSKLTMVEGDVYARLSRDADAGYDLIVIDVDHSPEDQLAEAEHPFYSAAGLLAAKRHLNVGGVLAVWSYAEDSRFATALRATFRHVRVEQITTFNALVDCEQTDWLFFAFD